MPDELLAVSLQLLAVDIGHEPEFQAGLPLDARPTVHEEQAGLHADKIIGRLGIKLFDVAARIVNAGQSQVVIEINVAGAPQPIDFPIGIRRVQAEEGVDFNILDLAAVGEPQRVVE